MKTYPRIEGALELGAEACDWGVDPDSGAKVVRLTSMGNMSHNIYCEQPYSSPDGRRLLVTRTFDMFDVTRKLMIADLHELSLTQVEPAILAEAIAHAAWSEWAYYFVPDGSLRRVSLMTLERQAVLPPGMLTPPPRGHIDSITDDGQWLIGYEKVKGRELLSYAFNLHTHERKVIAQGPENRNPHSQAQRGSGARVLYQKIVSDPQPGVPVFVHDLETGADTQLPLGRPWSSESSGHMAWVAQTGKVACAMGWLRDQKKHDPRHPEGNLLIAAPGDKQPTVFPAPDHGFYHVSVSKCGRYFVCDDFMDFQSDGFVSGPPGPIRIVVGNLESGRSRVLLRDCQAYGIAGSSRFEPDPYLTADNKYVIYNGSPQGTVQVFAARVPDEFWRSLD